MKLINSYNGYREPVWQSLFIAEFELPSGIAKTDSKFLTIPCYNVELPSVDITEQELHYINTKFWYSTGEYNIDDVSLGFINYNIGQNSARSMLYSWQDLQVNFRQGTRGYAGSGPDALDGYKGNLTVYELNNDGKSVHTVWIFVGGFPKNVPGSSKNWESKSELDRVDGVNFRYDVFYRIHVNTPVIGGEEPGWTTAIDLD